MYCASPGLSYVRSSAHVDTKQARIHGRTRLLTVFRLSTDRLHAGNDGLPAGVTRRHERFSEHALHVAAHLIYRIFVRVNDMQLMNINVETWECYIDYVIGVIKKRGRAHLGSY